METQEDALGNSPTDTPTCIKKPGEVISYFHIIKRRLEEGRRKRVAHAISLPSLNNIE